MFFCSYLEEQQLRPSINNSCSWGVSGTQRPMAAAKDSGFSFAFPCVPSLHHLAFALASQAVCVDNGSLFNLHALLGQKKDRSRSRELGGDVGLREDLLLLGPK